MDLFSVHCSDDHHDDDHDDDWRPKLGVNKWQKKNTIYFIELNQFDLVWFNIIYIINSVLAYAIYIKCVCINIYAKICDLMMRIIIINLSISISDHYLYNWLEAIHTYAYTHTHTQWEPFPYISLFLYICYTQHSDSIVDRSIIAYREPIKFFDRAPFQCDIHTYIHIHKHIEWLYIFMII